MNIYNNLTEFHQREAKSRRTRQKVHYLQSFICAKVLWRSRGAVGASAAAAARVRVTLNRSL
jgi:hypothetical protein